MLWLTNLLADSSSFSIKENLDLFEQHAGSMTSTAKMISRLIEESKRSTMLFINLNSEILDNFARFHNMHLTTEVNDMKATSKFIRERKFDATILHLENYTAFENFFPIIRREDFLYDGHFIIVYDSADEQEIEKIFSKFWKAYIYNVNVLVTDEISSDLVSVFTYIPFPNESCGDTKPIRINVFNKTTMNWTTTEFFPKKFKQLNRCPLRFVGYDNRARFKLNESESGMNRYSGIDVDIVILFSNAMNFSLNISLFDPVASDAFPKILDNKADFVMATLQLHRVEILDASQMIYSDTLILVVPPPFPIVTLTKVFLPFSIASWISIGMVAVLSFCVVKILKFTPKILHDYVIGKNVKGSMLNVWNIFLGGPQPILPRSNFPRYLLAKFLIFTLIMRSVYQGKVFDIMKRDVRTVELKTIDEFIEHEFTFYVYPYLVIRLNGSRVMQRFGLFKFKIVLKPAGTIFEKVFSQNFSKISGISQKFLNLFKYVFREF